VSGLRATSSQAQPRSRRKILLGRGSVAPGKMGGHRKAILELYRAFIRERISQTPHLTLHALKDELAARGIKVSHNAVWLFLRREGPRFKKNAARPRASSLRHRA
jgi:transposase